MNNENHEDFKYRFQLFSEGNISIVITTENPQNPTNWIDGNVIEVDAYTSNSNDCHYDCVIYIKKEWD